MPPVGHTDHSKFAWRLLNSVYGLPDAGANFEKLLHSVFVKLGYTMTIEGI